jgi:predicted nucleotidyltransferase component of viral defense system
MNDINRHKFYLVSVLKDIYSDTELAALLGFKGGTAQMLFYDLPRFSVDLDFNLLNPERSTSVFTKIRSLLLEYGKIRVRPKSILVFCLFGLWLP